jgi:hypothetical protein
VVVRWDKGGFNVVDEWVNDWNCRNWVAFVFSRKVLACVLRLLIW